MLSPTVVPRVVFVTVNIRIRQSRKPFLDGLLLPAVDDDATNCYGKYSSYNLNCDHTILLSIEPWHFQGQLSSGPRCTLFRKTLSIGFVRFEIT